MKRTARLAFIVAAILIAGMMIPSESTSLSCTLTSCLDCGYFPTTKQWECAVVYRNARCDCTPTGDGCDLGSLVCNYDPSAC